MLSEVIYNPAGTIENGTLTKASSVRLIFRVALNRDAVVLRGEDADRAWRDYRKVVDPAAVFSEDLDALD